MILSYLEPLHGAVVALPVVRRLGDQLQVLVAEGGGGVAAGERRPQARGGHAAPRQLRDVEVEGVLEQEQSVQRPVILAGWRGQLGGDVSQRCQAEPGVTPEAGHQAGLQLVQPRQPRGRAEHPSPEKGYTSTSGSIIFTKATF